MNSKQLWEAVLGELELNLSKANFTTWFKNTFILEVGEQEITVAVPNAFTKAWLEKKYHKYIIDSLKNVTEKQISKVNYVVETKEKNNNEIHTTSINPDGQEKFSQTSQPANTNQVNKVGLNPKYTFANFVVGKGNELAHAACLAVSKKSGEVYNPLFIYGGVGLGKTHLMQAVGNFHLQKNPQKKVLYVTSEKFTNDFIQLVQQGEAKKFKEKYRLVDILLIDDIQFLAGKEQTQEEFFHTFNALHQDNKQIIISSDRPPKAIPALEHRLISRFEWGMIVDVNAPDLETRIAIFKAKMSEKNLSLSDNIVRLIATSIQNNVRELEGILNKIIAYHQLNNSQPTEESVKNIISSLSTNIKKSHITPKRLIQTVAQYFDIETDGLVGNSRKKELVVPRQIVMYLMREELDASYPNIGQELGGRDHTTAMHACNKINREVEEDEKISRDIEMIKQRLYNSE
jgi:chromosomal replication initiator protein